MTFNSVAGVGVIGAGAISSRYLENLMRFPDIEVLFIADLDLDRARVKAEQHGVPASGTPDELLAHPGIEIVVNLTIPAAHVDVTLQALRSGKHVWSEKPFALDRAGGKEVLAEANRLGLRIAAAPDTFLGPGLQTVKRLVDEGRIGTPLTALALFQVPGPEAWHPNPEFLYAAGGGPLCDMGPYYLTALVEVLGPVARAAATSSTARTSRVIGSGSRAGEQFPVCVPTHFSALLEFESGASAQIVLSFQSPLRRTGFIEVTGTDATIIAPDPDGFDGDIRIVTEEDEVAIPTVARATRGTGVVELARAIRSGVPERASGALAYHILDIMVSIDEAAERGAFVDVTSTAALLPALPVNWDPLAANQEL